MKIIYIRTHSYTTVLTVVDPRGNGDMQGDRATERESWRTRERESEREKGARLCVCVKLLQELSAGWMGALCMAAALHANHTDIYAVRWAVDGDAVHAEFICFCGYLWRAARGT